MRAQSAYLASNIAATTDPFSLKAGKYGVSCVATFGGGSVTLQKLAADGVTYVTALTAITAAIYTTVDLPEGTYRLLVATATAIYVGIDRIPGE